MDFILSVMIPPMKGHEPFPKDHPKRDGLIQKDPLATRYPMDLRVGRCRVPQEWKLDEQ